MGESKPNLLDQEILDIVRGRRVVSASDLSKHFDRTRNTILRRLRKLRREGRIMTYRARMNAGRGSIKYTESDFLDNGHAGDLFAFLDPVEFAEFFESEILKIELKQDMGKGVKTALTSHVKSRLPDEAVKHLRKKYIKNMDG